ncbi:MAG: DUF1624 domain-containing protein, partial [Deltaproteobacteria bacterium]|nr:DUF1624 domain-containing protein [Deltaproteobacteria bacterium]
MRRVVFVDVLRLLALLQMVNGHTLDAVMAEHLRSGPVFERYVGFRGWVSVAFMLAAGLAYHLTTFARFDAYLADTGGRVRRARRAAMIVGLGFLLRFPFDAFGSDPVRAETALANLVRVDVLHAIGLSILLLEGISSLARTPWMARAVAGVAGISLIAL